MAVGPSWEGHHIWEGWVTLTLIGIMLAALVLEIAPPYLVMTGTLILFLPLNILTLDQALHGFGDHAVLSIGVLFIVAKGIEQSGGLEYVSRLLFRADDDKKEDNPAKQGNIVGVMLKFTVPVAIFSAFLANIPLVAMMIPPIVEFAKKVHMAPSKLLMPLSFAALLGGTLTLIGASTNLVVVSLAAKKLPELQMNLFEIAIVGLPVTIAGILYMVAVSGKLLPDRLAIQPTTINVREYSVVLEVKATSSLTRKTIERAGINRQPGLNLVQIQREGVVTPNPGPDFVIMPKDKLHFGGVIDAVLGLTQLDGLALSESEGEEQIDLNRLKINQCLVEAVVASGSPMVHKRVADLQLRARYKAAIVAIHRYGVRLSSAIGDIILEAGDSLLMVADGTEFVAKNRNNSTFALVAKLPGFVLVQRHKAGIAALIVLAFVVASGIGVDLITAALFTAFFLLATKCLTPRDAMSQALQESIELPVLILIASSFGISEAMVQSGAADMVAKALMGLAGTTKFGLISCTYIATTVFSLAITNNAAVTIMFPVALTAAQRGNLDFRPFAYTLMMASSAGLMTPTGCATNLMVYSPGGYKFADYVVYGGPMQIWLLVVTIGVTVTIEWWWAWTIAIFITTVATTPIWMRQPWNLIKSGPLSSAEDQEAAATSRGRRGDEERVSLTGGSSSRGSTSSAFMLASQQ
ncbi:putative sulfur deprivation response regulator [Selaginella moellendorffii]|uniref:putative sulfur deprivation response regulator n=1 Tax=Selaginella moellendorffii TaxID=88036 RepID=UPI000D1CC877|nr:putative sulfur deprivation response regulator [Selaginella moellendorffii]|eukprot:XP_024545096.1 putative sulfur deprivation response regulator [Selaginella moellendorffii]